jgi:hypothetical protein
VGDTELPDTIILSLKDGAPLDVTIDAGLISCTNEDVEVSLDQDIVFEKKFTPFISPQEIVVDEGGNGTPKMYKIANSTDAAFAAELCSDTAADTKLVFTVIEEQSTGTLEVDKKDILGITFSGNTATDSELPVDVSLKSIGDNFLMNCDHFNSPLAFPNTLIPNGSDPAIGSNFMRGCTSFNKPLLFPEGIDGKIGTYFMNDCTDFNHSLSLQGNCNEIGANFMNGCTNFNQNIGLPNGLATIDDNFLAGCADYNKTISIPSGVKNIKNYFLSGCTAYNEEISMPDGLTRIDNYFLSGCTSYNQVINLGESLEGIYQYFLNGCASYDCDLTLPNSLHVIDIGFMHNCNAMTRTISFGTSFDANHLAISNDNFSTTDPSAPCYVQGIRITGTNAGGIINNNPNSLVDPYRNISIPTQTASITLTDGSQYYLSDNNNNISKALCASSEPSTSSNVTVNTVALGALTVKRNQIKGLVFNNAADTSLKDIGKYFLDNCSSFNTVLTLPNSVINIDDCFMKNCTSFNSYLYFPVNSALDEIEASFMDGCKAFNKPIVLPASLTDIGSIFMSGCQSFNQQLNIPRSVNSLDGDNFLSNCYNFTSTVCFMDMGTGIFKNMQLPTTFLAMDKDCNAFTKGIHIKGTQRAAIHNKFPNNDFGIFGGKRKLLEIESDVTYANNAPATNIVEDDNFLASVIAKGGGTIHDCTGNDGS